MRMHVVKVSKDQSNLVVERTNDKAFSTESTLLYAIKNNLIALGFDVIKKRIWKDGEKFGHLFGDETTQYIRTRNNIKGENSFWVVDLDYALRLLHTDFNQKKRVVLSMTHGIQ